MHSHTKLYTIEYERDPEGNKIPDRVWGYKLTEKTLRARREVPVSPDHDERPRAHGRSTHHFRADPRRSDLELPGLHHGLAFTTEQLPDRVECYELQLVDLPLEKYNLRIRDAFCEVDSLLSGACKMILRITAPMEVDNEWMVPLFDNYNWWSERLVPEEEEEVVAIIRRALKINTPLKWYYDASPS